MVTCKLPSFAFFPLLFLLFSFLNNVEAHALDLVGYARYVSYFFQQAWHQLCLSPAGRLHIVGLLVQLQCTLMKMTAISELGAPLACPLLPPLIFFQLFMCALLAAKRTIKHPSAMP